MEKARTLGLPRNVPRLGFRTIQSHKESLLAAVEHARKELEKCQHDGNNASQTRSTSYRILGTITKLKP